MIIDLAMIFLDITPKAQATDTWDYIKLKIFYSSKETTNRMKGNLWNGRKYLEIIYLIIG